MSREVRRVPANWEHPKDESGDFQPLYGGSFQNAAAKWDEGKKKWDEGLRDDWQGGWQPKDEKEMNFSYEEWDGERPSNLDYMPDWPEAERTHLQMYETTTEGTPISPVMETPEELAKWLAENGVSAFGAMTASYEQWLGTIRRGWAPGLFFNGVEMMSGVEMETKN